MKTILKILLTFFLLISTLHAQIVVDDDKDIIVFKKSEIYYDKSHQESINTLIQKPELFQVYHKSI